MPLQLTIPPQEHLATEWPRRAAPLWAVPVAGRRVGRRPTTPKRGLRLLSVGRYGYPVMGCAGTADK